MARSRQENAEEARQALFDAAERFVTVRRGAVVIVARGQVDVIWAGPELAPPGRNPAR